MFRRFSNFSKMSKLQYQCVSATSQKFGKSSYSGQTAKLGYWTFFEKLLDARHIYLQTVGEQTEKLRVSRNLSDVRQFSLDENVARIAISESSQNFSDVWWIEQSHVVSVALSCNCQEKVVFLQQNGKVNILMVQTSYNVT